MLKFLDYMVSFDLINEHLRKVHDNEMIVHCLQKEIQNELVQLLVNSTKEKHLAKVNLVKNFSRTSQELWILRQTSAMWNKSQ